MNTLFLHFNQDGTIRTGTLRISGEKAADMEIWELWELYQTLISTGAKPIVLHKPDYDEIIHMINY